MPKYAIAIHGGAGNIQRDKVEPNLEAAIRNSLNNTLQQAIDIIDRNGPALDAVTTAVKMLEDSPYFNAGVGSVFTHDETHVMDASVMEGHTRNAGAVAGIRHVRNPILLARKVMERSEHVFMIGDGAEAFANTHDLEMVENSYFSTDHRKKQLDKAKRTGSTALDHDVALEDRIGTVGAVAVDRMGNVAAATSTGGMANRRFGRVGDSAIVGAGTYADKQSCAVSCTGTGEHYIRLSAANKVSDFIKYLDLTINEASRRLIFERLPEIGGKGGLIAVDPYGNIEMPFNTSGMYRASFQQGGKIQLALYEDELPAH